MEVAENEDSIIAYSLVALGSSGFEVWQLFPRRETIAIVIFVGSAVILNHYWLTFKMDMKENEQ